MKDYTITVWMDNDYTNDKEHIKVHFTVPDYVDLNGFKKTITENLELARNEDIGDISFSYYRFFEWLCNNQVDGWNFYVEEDSDWQFDFDNNCTFDTDSYYSD